MWAGDQRAEALSTKLTYYSEEERLPVEALIDGASIVERAARDRSELLITGGLRDGV